MQNFSEILTIQEVAAELRCSKTHVQHAINGRLTGVPRLTHVSMGRRKLIRRDWLNEWLEASKL
jgi:excisionase family DNA binding protein